MSQSRMQLYGVKGGSNKDQKTLLHEQLQASKAKLQVKDEYLKAYRLTKNFNHNLQRYIAYAISNKIFVACADTFNVLDILRSPDHTTPIQCFDVSEVSKDVVTFSEGNGPMQQTLVVFGLEDESYLNGIDSSVTKQMTTVTQGYNTFVPKQQQLKWRQYWKCGADMLAFPGFLNTLSISPIGDILLLGGNEYLSLWTRDSRISAHSFTQIMFYGANPPKDLYAQEIAQTQVGQVIQSEFSRDGRLFITLEQDNKTKKRSLHVWYNQNAAFLPESRLDRGEPVDPNEFLTRLQKLECFDLQARRGVTVRYFKMLPYNLSIFAQQEVVPITLITVSEQSQAHLWVEDLQLPPDFYSQNQQAIGDEKYSGISFTCIQVFSHPNYKLPADKINAFDVQFLQLQSEVNATNFVETTIQSMSPMLNPVELDKVQLWKFRQAQKCYKLFDNMIDKRDSRYFNSNTQDFLILLKDSSIEIHKITGLRNTFQSQICAYSTELKHSHLLDCSPYFLPKKLLLANQPTAPLSESNESINLLGLTQHNELITNLFLNKDNQRRPAWQLRHMVALNGSRYSKARVVEVQTLSLRGIDVVAVLLLTGSGAHQLQFYVQSPQFLEMGGQANIKLIGVYDSQLHFQAIRFVGPLPQVMGLMKDGTLRVVFADCLQNVFAGLQNKDAAGAYQKLRECQEEYGSVVLNFQSIQIGQNLIAKGSTGVDFVVQGYRLDSSSEQLTQVIDLVILTSTGQSEFYKVKIQNSSQLTVEVKNTLTLGMGEKTQIVELLCLHQEQVDDRPYLSKGIMTKCLITAVNDKAQMEVRFLNILNEDIQCVWKQVLPDQASRASIPNSTRINQRGTVVPAQSNQSLMGAALGAVYRGMTQVAAPVLQLPVAAQELGYDVDGRMSGSIATILTRHLKKQWYFLYIYDHKHENKYIGYLDLLSFIDFGSLDRTVMLKSGFALDYAVPQSQHDNISILLSAMDSLYLISYNKSRDIWETIRTLKNLTGIQVAYQNNKMLTSSRCPLLIQDSELIPISLFGDQAADKSAKETLALCQFQNQVSHPFYSVSILEDLYFNGRKEFVMKIFIKINEALKRELTHLDHLKQNSAPNSPIKSKEESSSDEVKISTIVYGSLGSLLNEINSYILSQVVQREELAQELPEASNQKGAGKKKDAAIDDFFGGDDDSDDDFMGDGGLIDFDNLPSTAQTGKQDKKVEESKPQAPQISSTESEFMAIQDDLLRNLAKSKDFKDSPLIDFLLKFSNIHAKDFFSDDMCSILLRQIYLETEVVDRSKYEELTKQDKPIEDTKVIKELAMHEVYAEMYGEKNEDYLAAEYKMGKGNLRALGKWDSRKCALALFTVNQDVVLEELQERFELDSNSSWGLVRDLCMPVWVKDPYRLRGIVEHISKVAYKEQGDENQSSAGVGGQPKSQAEAASLWYILMNKRPVLISLFEKEKATGGDKVATLLAKDFTLEKSKQVARKNAAVLQAKHRYLMAATLLILGDDVPNALQLMKQKRFLGDPLMAILTCRMLCLQQPGNKELTKLLGECWQEYFVDRGERYGDIYLTAIGLWGQEKYVQALNSLQAAQVDSDPAVEYIFKQEKGFLQKTCDSGEKPPKDEYCPQITDQSGSELGNMIQKLKKAPKVTAALNKDTNATAYGADMAAIWASPTVEKQEEKKEEEEKLEITIDSPTVLCQMLKVCIQKQDMMSAIFLLRENRENIAPRMPSLLKSIRMICVQVLKDLIFEISQNPAYLSPVESIHTQIESLLGFLLDFDPSEVKAKKDDGKPMISGAFTDKEQLEIVRGYLKRCIQLDVIAILESLQGSRGSTKGSSTLLRYELELKLDIRSKESPNGILANSVSSMKSILSRLDEQTFKFLEFVTLSTQAPAHKNRTRFSEIKNLNEYREMILELEQHIDCLIIFDHFEDSKDLEGSALDHLDSSGKEPKREVREDHIEYVFFTEQPSAEKGNDDSQPKKEEKKKDDPFDGFFGGDDDESDGIDLMDMDFSAAPKKQEPKPAPVQQDDEPPSRVKLDIPEEDPQESQFEKCYFQTLGMIQRLSSKMRKSLIMHLCLITLSFQMSKFYIFRDLVSTDDLQKLFLIDSAKLLELLKVCHQMKSQAQNPQEQSKLELRLIAIQEEIKKFYQRIHFQNLKTFIQKFKCAIEKRLSKLVDLKGDDEDDKNDDDGYYGIDESIESGKKKQDDPSQQGVEENLWQDRWETEIATAIDVYKNQIYSAANAELQALGGVGNSEQVVPQTYEFLRIWFQFIIMEKSREILEKGMTPSFCEFVEIAPAVSLLGPLQNKIKNEIYEKTHEEKVVQEIESITATILDTKFNCKNIKQNFKFISTFLENETTVFFKERLNVIQRHFIVTQLKQGSPELFPYLLKFFFKNKQKMNEFFTFLNVNAQFVKPLHAQYLTLLCQSCTAEQEEIESVKKLSYPVDMASQQASPEKPQDKKEDKKEHVASSAPTQALVRELLGTGVEAFKQRGEQISDFAFDNTGNSDNVVMGLVGSGIREIPIVSTLIFRNRIESGLQLIDEENLEWSECLHRYDPIEQNLFGERFDNQKQAAFIAEKDDPIVATIDSLYAKKTIYQRARPSKYVSQVLADVQAKPPTIWNGADSSAYLASKSKLDITHEDFTQAIESHPHLPLYVSGNRRGILSTWQFGQTEDKSLYQFMPEVDPRQADAKKASVKKIMFNAYGDKVLSNNAEGSFSIYKMDAQSKKSLKIPIFALYDSVDTRVTDFDLVNSDNVLCTISTKQKTIKIYDTLLPYSFGKQGCVMEYKQQKSEACGNMILCNQRKQVVYTFNGRTGLMAELDLRMNLNMVTQHQLSQSNEITAVCLNQANDTLVTGYKDGHIKIHSLHQYYFDENTQKQELRMREKIEAFPFDFRSKKGLVCRIKINHKNGGLFASSQSGTLKLIRTKV